MIAHFIYNGFMYVIVKLFQTTYIIRTYELPININDLNVRIHHRVLNIQPFIWFVIWLRNTINDVENAFKSSIFFLILIQGSCFFIIGMHIYLFIEVEKWYINWKVAVGLFWHGNEICQLDYLHCTRQSCHIVF